MPLQDIPQKFSSMHSWQIANPHLHLQQKGAALLQQLQLISLAFSRFRLYADLFAEVVIFCCYIAVHPLLSRSGALFLPLTGKISCETGFIGIMEINGCRIIVKRLCII